MKTLIGIALLWGLLMAMRFALVSIGFFNLPAAIAALAFLTVLVLIIKPLADFLEPGAGTLIEYMPLFFIPVLVGVTAQQDLLMDQWVLIGFTVIGATLIGLVTAALAYRAFAGCSIAKAQINEGEADD